MGLKSYCDGKCLCLNWGWIKEFKPRLKDSWFHLKIVFSLLRFESPLNRNRFLEDQRRSLNSVSASGSLSFKRHLKNLKKYFLVTLHAKITIPAIQRYPKNLNLMKNEKILEFFWLWKGIYFLKICIAFYKQEITSLFRIEPVN